MIQTSEFAIKLDIANKLHPLVAFTVLTPLTVAKLSEQYTREKNFACYFSTFSSSTWWRLKVVPSEQKDGVKIDADLATAEKLALTVW